MKLKAIAVLIIATLGLCMSVKAQDMAGMVHPTPTPGVSILPAGTIHGDQTPEQIPDIVAFRLWLTRFDMTKPLDTQMPNIGLSGSDAAILQQAVQSHLLQHSSIINDHNGATQASNTADVSRFWDSTYNLTRNTLTGLQVRLSNVGLAQFMRYLEREKGGMVVGPYDMGLGEVAKRNLRMSNPYAGSPQIMFGTQTTANYSAYFSQAMVYPAITNTTGFTNTAGNWTTLAGSFSFTNGIAHVVTNGTGADFEAYAHWHYPTTADQRVSVKLATLPQSGKDSGITVRAAASGETFFDAKFYSYNGQGYILIDQMVNGTDTFQQAYAYTQAVNDTLEIDIVGPYYNVLINGSLINTFSASAITRGVPGITGVVGGGDLKNFTMKSGYGIGVNAHVTGTTSCNGASCPPTSITHTGYATITAGTQGGSTHGNSVPYNGYLSGSNYVVLIAPIDPTTNATTSVDIEVHVQCSSIGTFWSSVILYDTQRPWKSKMIWGSNTWGSTVSWHPDGVGGYSITTKLNCTPETTPPDNVPLGVFNLVYTHEPYPSWLYWGGCEMIWGQLFYCISINPQGFNINEVLPPQNCTAKAGTLYPSWVYFY
jgi:hypothetical protein